MSQPNFGQPKVTRWEEDEAPTENLISEILRGKGLNYYLWSNNPNDLYAPHVHTYNKIIYVVRGSITFILPERDQKLMLHPGDRLELPAKTVHSAVISSKGVTCFEVHQ